MFEASKKRINPIKLKKKIYRLLLYPLVFKVFLRMNRNWSPYPRSLYSIFIFQTNQTSQNLEIQLYFLRKHRLHSHLSCLIESINLKVGTLNCVVLNHV